MTGIPSKAVLDAPAGFESQAVALESLPLPEVAPAREWVVFDLETTGLSPAHHEIIQIAALRMLNGRVQPASWFFSYVNPHRAIPRWISEFTGVTEAQVANAPDSLEILRAFSDYVGRATLIAHNGHRFDMQFLAMTCARHHVPYREVGYHDSLGLSWMLWGRHNARHGLDFVLQRLGLSQHGLRRHDARDDTALLAKAIETMWPRLLEHYPDPPWRRYTGVIPK